MAPVCGLSFVVKYCHEAVMYCQEVEGDCGEVGRDVRYSQGLSLVVNRAPMMSSVKFFSSYLPNYT